MTTLTHVAHGAQPKCAVYVVPSHMKSSREVAVCLSSDPFKSAQNYTGGSVHQSCFGFSFGGGEDGQRTSSSARAVLDGNRTLLSV